jgi:metal-responsive CopG/Arc/MetJ family transcriptional regulator
MRRRVTISLPGSLLRDAERIGRRRGLHTRSAVVVDALELLVRRATAQEIDASLDAYYGARPASELKEERAMVRAFRRSRRRLDLDRDD